jgi:hypothetical protein
MAPDICEAWMDGISAALGLLGSLLLAITAWRATPLQAVVDTAHDADAKAPGDSYLVAAKVGAENRLADIRRSERTLLFTGASCLILSFVLSLLKHFV